MRSNQICESNKVAKTKKNNTIVIAEPTKQKTTKSAKSTKSTKKPISKSANDSIKPKSAVCDSSQPVDNNDNTVIDTSIIDTSMIATSIIASTTTTNKHNRDILVLSGGASKGIAQIGALHCMKKHNMLPDVKTIAATSAGSMTGLLYIMGYQPLEMYRIIKLIDLEMVKDINAYNLITKYGLDDGTRLMLVIKKLMIAKGYDTDITFLDLYAKTNVTFIVTGACITDKKPYYFSYIDYPDMKVIDAIRISSAFPIAFTPIMYDGKMFIDGGCIDNFPIHLFNNEMDHVVGIYVAECRKVVNEINNIEDFLTNMMECLFEGVTYRDNVINNKCVVMIRCSTPGETPSDLENMFNEGFNAAKIKIDAHDFD